LIGDNASADASPADSSRVFHTPDHHQHQPQHQQEHQQEQQNELHSASTSARCSPCMGGSSTQGVKGGGDGLGMDVGTMHSRTQEHMRRLHQRHATHGGSGLYPNASQILQQQQQPYATSYHNNARSNWPAATPVVAGPGPGPGRGRGNGRYGRMGMVAARGDGWFQQYSPASQTKQPAEAPLHTFLAQQTWNGIGSGSGSRGRGRARVGHRHKMREVVHS
jgi:hypothetical protein